MLHRSALALLFAFSTVALAQLPAQTTLPIVFTKTISAARSHTGDVVEAQTTQVVHLSNGVVIPAGAKVTGHVEAASPFVYDETPYAQQKQSVLGIHFDSIAWHGRTEPLHVSVRAMADPATSDHARSPEATIDDDPHPDTQLIGGASYAANQRDVKNADGDVVAYNKRDGVYAHLIASGHCDASNVEVSVDIYSPSACGLYGFSSVTETSTSPAALTLASTHTSPEIWKNSTALLEVAGN